MSRPLRIAYAGVWCHVMNHGRASTFPEKQASPALLETVAEAPERFRREVHAVIGLGHAPDARPAKS
jgi:hypothetical protein